MIELYKHNQEAYDAVTEHFKESHRTCVVCATGTGKSRIALKLIEDNITKNFLYIASSNPAITDLKNDLRNEVNKYLTNRHVTFSLYQGLGNLYMWLKDQPENKYDYIIIDEFHHYGAPKYGEWIDHILDLNPNTRIFGMTATPVRSSDGRDIAAELFHGDIAYTLSLPEAINRNILPMPQIILCILDTLKSRKELIRDGHTTEEINYWQKKSRHDIDIYNGLGGLFRKYIPDPNGHYIVFCQSISQINALISDGSIKKWFSPTSKHVHIFIDHSKHSSRYNNLDAFNKCTRKGIKILLCVDKLNESVHPTTGINGLIFLRPTKSQQVYLQQMGRALSANFSNAHPVIFDIVGNTRAIRLRESVWNKIENTGKKYETKIEFVADFVEKEKMQVYSDLVRNTTLNRIPWNVAYEEARIYYRTHHNLHVPKNYRVNVEVVKRDSRNTLVRYYATLNLYDWVNTQRLRYHHESGRSKPSSDQIKMLELINIEWDYEPMWMECYNYALQFYRLNNHSLNVNSGNCPGQFHLDRWLERMRMKYHHLISPYLNETQIRLLNELSMDWTLRNRDNQWKQNYQEACDLCEKYGSFQLSSKGETAHAYIWLKRQCKKADAGQLSEEKSTLIQQLREKYPVSHTLSDNVKRIKACMKRLHTESLRPDSGDTEEKTCYNMQSYIRKKYNQGKLSPDEVSLLQKEQILIARAPRTRKTISDEDLINACSEFIGANNGSTHIPQKYVWKNLSIGRKIHTLQQKYAKSGTIGNEKLQKCLLEMGVIM